MRETGMSSVVLHVGASGAVIWAGEEGKVRKERAKKARWRMGERGRDGRGLAGTSRTWVTDSRLRSPCCPVVLW